mgnify:CR=1 FL=1
MLAQIVFWFVIAVLVLCCIGAMWIGFDYGKNSGKAKDDAE